MRPSHLRDAAVMAESAPDTEAILAALRQDVADADASVALLRKHKGSRDELELAFLRQTQARAVLRAVETGEIDLAALADACAAELAAAEL